MLGSPEQKMVQTTSADINVQKDIRGRFRTYELNVKYFSVLIDGNDRNVML